MFWKSKAKVFPSMFSTHSLLNYRYLFATAECGLLIVAHGNLRGVLRQQEMFRKSKAKSYGKNFININYPFDPLSVIRFPIYNFDKHIYIHFTWNANLCQKETQSISKIEKFCLYLSGIFICVFNFTCII